MSIQYMCDDQIDCLVNEPTDEMKCQCKRTQVYSNHCKFVRDIPGKTACSSFYMLMKENVCQVLVVNEDGLVESDVFDTKLQKKVKNNCEIAVEASVHLQDHFRPLLFNGSRANCFFDAYRNFNHISNSFVCINGKKISLELLNDLVADFGPQEEDEFLFKSLATGIKFLCSESKQLPCMEGHNKCYDIFEICTYKLSTVHHLLPCRTGQHLQNYKAFKCNAKYKCPDYYCISWAYVCDGKWDCPHGCDENLNYCGTTDLCLHKFICRNSQICIHILDVCNNEIDCQYGDDEFICTLSTECVKQCDCLGFTIRCFNVRNIDDIFIVNFHFNSIHIKYSSQAFITTVLLNVKLIAILNLNENNITLPCKMLPTLQRSLIIDLSFNFIKKIRFGFFQNAPYLAEIRLSNNKLKTISEKAFLNLPSLLLIDLSCNQLKQFLSFLGSFRLIFLDLRQNKFIHLASKITSEMKVNFLLTEDYYVYCLFPQHSNCITEKPWYASCKRLFSNSYMSVVAIFVFLLLFYF